MKGKLLGVGGTGEVFEVSKDKILKLYYNNVNSDVVNWEYNKSKTLFSAGLPVPKVYELIEEDGRLGIIMERINGKSYLQRMIECTVSGDTEEAIEYVKRTATILKTLHSYKGSIDDTMVDSLKRSLERVSGLTQEERFKLIRLINSLPQPICVCHGDPNPGNIIETPDGARLIDWMSSFNGHPYYDIADFIVMMEYAHMTPGIPENISKSIKDSSKLMTDVIIKEYGIGEENLNLLDSFITVALLSKLGGSSPDNEKAVVIVDLQKRLKAIN
ncbi:Aminoglycoside phosphotransferase [Clostridium bornimense]|uniref:Aminoglycoside phosphotransferase n=1 Tax=Clostridium bornimense TaxID=1216932 RepID=W6S2Z0_9CLOT|nr:phosphotransferase [Clostridium bornimense]CDM70279.1 Aminoglycoside phosphotransferase [Clostridium bornimense]